MNLQKDMKAAGGDCKKISEKQVGEMQKVPTLMLDPVRFFLIQSLRSSWLVMSFPKEITDQGVEFDCKIMTLN